MLRSNLKYFSTLIQSDPDRPLTDFKKYELLFLRHCQDCDKCKQEFFSGSPIPDSLDPVFF